MGPVLETCGTGLSGDGTDGGVEFSSCQGDASHKANKSELGELQIENSCIYE